MVNGRAALGSMRRQIAINVVFVVIMGVTLAASAAVDGGIDAQSWIERNATAGNLIVVAMFLFHLGILRQQFSDLRGRLKALESWKSDSDDDKTSAARESGEVGARLHAIEQQMATLTRALVPLK